MITKQKIIGQLHDMESMFVHVGEVTTPTLNIRNAIIRLRDAIEREGIALELSDLPSGSKVTIELP